MIVVATQRSVEEGWDDPGEQPDAQGRLLPAERSRAHENDLRHLAVMALEAFGKGRRAIPSHIHLAQWERRHPRLDPLYARIGLHQARQRAWVEGMRVTDPCRRLWPIPWRRTMGGGLTRVAYRRIEFRKGATYGVLIGTLDRERLRVWDCARCRHRALWRPALRCPACRAQYGTMVVTARAWAAACEAGPGAASARWRI